MSDPLYKEIERLEVQVHFERDRANRRGEEIKRLRDALALIESVYRRNCVNEGEPSSVLSAVQEALKGRP